MPADSLRGVSEAPDRQEFWPNETRSFCYCEAAFAVVSKATKRRQPRPGQHAEPSGNLAKVGCNEHRVNMAMISVYCVPT
jgi:hypothetical protein